MNSVAPISNLGNPSPAIQVPSMQKMNDELTLEMENTWEKKKNEELKAENDFLHKELEDLKDVTSRNKKNVDDLRDTVYKLQKTLEER